MNHFRSPTLAALLVPIFAITGAPILSAADGDVSPAVDARLKALEQQIQDLKNRPGAASAGTAPVPATQAFVRASPDDGFVLESLDGSNRLRIGGFADVDGRFFSDDRTYLDGNVAGANTGNAANTFLVRHIRPELTATVDDIFDFHLLAEFAPTQTANTNGYTQAPILYDASVAARINPALVVTVGQFKSPVGLEYLQYTTNDEFVELSLASQLVPGRDVGAQLSGKVLDGILSYQVGIFNGGIDGAANVYNDTGSGKDAEGRIIVAPFISSNIHWLEDLRVGIAGTWGNELGTGTATTDALPSFKTTSQLTWFAYNAAAYANGQHLRYSPQLYWAAGSFSTLDEYVASKQRVSNGTPGNDGYVSNKAYQIEAGYILTGEKASYYGVAPASPVQKGGWGAWEVVGRIDHLEVDRNAFTSGDAAAQTAAQDATEFAIGLNWYLNRNIKVQLDYELTQFNGGAGTAAHVTNRHDENLIVTEFQVVF